MSAKRGKWYDFDFSDKRTKSIRKTASIVLLVVIIVGYLLIVAFNVFVFTSMLGLRVIPQEYIQSTPDNETIVMQGSALIKNDHWNSLSVHDLRVGLNLYTDEGYSIYNETLFTQIPRLQNTVLNLSFTISFGELSLETFASLNNTEYIQLDLSLSFRYGLYGLAISLNTQITVGDD